MAKEHEEALALAKAAMNEWKSKYDNVKNELSLKLELKEAQVKNSMMAVAWTAHTSALQMRMTGFGNGSGSPMPGGGVTPPPANPFAAFI